MNKAKLAALEAAGFVAEDAAEFLELSESERLMVELRLAVSRAIRNRRMAQKMTQQQLAARMSSSQSRVAKIESAAGDVSLDLMMSSYFAVGGRIADLAYGEAAPSPKKTAKPARTRSKKPV